MLESGRSCSGPEVICDHIFFVFADEQLFFLGFIFLYLRVIYMCRRAFFGKWGLMGEVKEL